MVAADFFMPFAPDLLFRNKMTAPQADLAERQERLGNVANIFTLNPMHAVAGRTVVLVDDICTTGATLSECARVLKSAGVKKVIALVVARG
jgi:predicted amidophosphoribosyltransferase